jgi:hypothetical protein
MSEDPKLFDAGDYNLYRYCHNDPEDFTDPMGLSAGPGTGAPEMTRWDFIVQRLQREFGSYIPHWVTVGSATATLTEQTQRLSMSVTADIRGPNQTGVKTIQAVSLSSQGQLKSLGNYTGYTNIPIGPNTSIPLRGFSQFSQSVTGTWPTFNVNLKGFAVAAPFAVINPPVLSIRYNLSIAVNFLEHAASLSGLHTGYPSFHAQGGGHELYDMHEGRSVFDLLPGREVPARAGPIVW